MRFIVAIPLLMTGLCVTSQIAGAGEHQADEARRAEDPQSAFYGRVKSLCGARYAGWADFPQPPGDAFRGQLLVAEIRDCGAEQIRIPFAVGEDRSRTWVLSRVEGGLQLKHDHRHEDGTPDEVTNYGGTTAEGGTGLSQSFPADAHTAALIPEASTNEWFLGFNEDATRLTYYLERHGQPRFRAVLARETPEFSRLIAFAERYAAAWSSRDPVQFSSHFAEDGRLSVNDGAPSVGRKAIADKAGSFMEGFPDMVVRLERLEQLEDVVRFHWRWTGTNTGPGGTGQAVDLTGYEDWTLTLNGLIAKSDGHYDEAEYQRQVAAGH